MTITLGATRRRASWLCALALAAVLASAEGRAQPDGKGAYASYDRRSHADRFLKILAQLGETGDLPQGVKAMLELRDGLPSTPSHALESRLLKRLARRDADLALVPVGFVYLGMMDEYLRKHQTRDLPRVRKLFDEILVEVATAEDPSGRQIAARLGSHHALILRDHGFLGDAETLFEQALLRDPDLFAARHAVAASQEKRAHYALARGHLQRLVAAESAGSPPDRLAHLRLALVEVRSGRSESARGRLETLSADPVAHWTVLLAFEELARLELAEGRQARALEVLEQGRARFAESEQLTVLLAWLLDNAGPPLEDRARARRLIEQLDALPPSGQSSPRRRYNDWPREGISALMQSQRADFADHVDDLARAVAALRGQKGKAKR